MKGLYWRSFILLFLGVWFLYKSYATIQSDSIFDGLVFFFIFISGISVYGWTLIKDRDLYLLTKKKMSYFPTILGAVILLIIGAYLYYQNSITNAKTSIAAFYDGGFNGFSIDLKENGTYIMANGSGLGSFYFYGTYTIKDSIITLDKSNIDGVIKSNKLGIKKYAPFSLINQDEQKYGYITELDEEGNEAKTYFKFRIVEDNR